MITYDVNIYQSEALTDYCDSDDDLGSKEAANNVKDVLESVFSNISGKSVSVSSNLPSIQIPKYATQGTSYVSVNQDLRTDNVYVGEDQNVNYPRPFSAPHPTHSDPYHFEVFTDGLRWWRYFVDEGGHVPKTDHSNLLLTSTGSGGGGRAFAGESPFAISRTGQSCAHFDTSWGLTGSASDFDGMQTAIHEIGHNLLENDPDSSNCDENSEDCNETSCSGTGQHSMGDYDIVDAYHQIYYVTAMSNGCYEGCIESENYCCDSIPNFNSSPAGKSLMFSDCAQQSMQS